MSLISVWLASTEQKHKILKKTIQILYYILTAFAIFLAIKDMSFLEKTSTKIWIFLLSIFFPELFVLLHGISTSSMGVNFFTGSPIEARAHSWYTPKRARTLAPDVSSDSSLPPLVRDGGLPSTPDLPDSSSSLF